MVASPLRVELGERGEETTVDEMLKGCGWTQMSPEQLAHLIAGLVAAPAVVQIKGFGEALLLDRFTLQSMLHLFGYKVESC